MVQILKQRPVAAIMPYLIRGFLLQHALSDRIPPPTPPQPTRLLPSALPPRCEILSPASLSITRRLPPSARHGANVGLERLRHAHCVPATTARAAPSRSTPSYAAGSARGCFLPPLPTSRSRVMARHRLLSCAYTDSSQATLLETYGSSSLMATAVSKPK